MIGLKRLLLTPLAFRPLGRLARPLLRDAMPVFMLHRFAHPDLGVAGVSPANLRASLEYLRGEGFNPVSLADLAAGHAPPSDGGVPVAFTVDDGYLDFLDIALPVFAEFDCPVSVFVSSGVIDGTCWYWWDSLRMMFEQSSCARLDVKLEEASLRFDLTDPLQREADLLDLIERLKTVPEATRLAMLEELTVALDVGLSPIPPAAFTTMSWEQIRACAKGGIVNFGPHTITHASLPMTTDSQAKDEILGSWRRLREECPAALPVFCYPFGAYSSREIELLRGTDMVGALTTEPCYSSRAPFSSARMDRQFAVPRFGYPEEPLNFRQIAIGLERVKMAWTHGRAGWHAKRVAELSEPSVARSA